MSKLTEKGADTRKEEILALSRQSKSDEGAEFAHAKGLKQGWLPLVIVSTALLIAAKISNLDYPFDIVTGTIIAAVLASFIGAPVYAYRFTKDKNHLIEAVIYTLFIVISVIRLVSILIGW
jgi:hypothetical protein